MYLVVANVAGDLRFNTMWAPAWIGLDRSLCAELQQGLHPFAGRPLTQELLQEAHGHLVDTLCAKYPQLPGLRHCLDALKSVTPT